MTPARLRVPRHPGIALPPAHRRALREASARLRQTLARTAPDSLWTSDSLRESAKVTIEALKAVVLMHLNADPKWKPARGERRILMPPSLVGGLRECLWGLDSCATRVPVERYASEDDIFFSNHRCYNWFERALEQLRSVQRLHRNALVCGVSA